MAAVLALLLLGASRASANSVVLYGGAASARYLYSGEPAWSFFFEQASHDLRFRAGGVLWHDMRRAATRLTTALFLGGAVSVGVPSQRLPIGSIQHTQTWRLAPRLELMANAGASVEPYSIAQTPSAGQAQAAVNLAGRPLLTLDGSAELGYRVRRDTLALLVGHDALVHFGEVNEGPEEVVSAGGIQLQATWTREINGRHSLLVQPSYRAMLAQTNTLSPVTGFVGGMVGWDVRFREHLRLVALGGAGSVVNLPRSHLWPVEPMLSIEGSYRAPRNLWTANGSWRVRENTYGSGLPMRTVEVRLAWQQPLSSRRLRGAADLSYLRMRTGHLECRQPLSAEEGPCPGITAAQRLADTLQLWRLQGLLTFSVARGWRLFAEAGLSVGHLGRETPACVGAECAGGAVPTAGFSVTTLFGVAYINASRVFDERVLDERVLNLVR